jgi:hypothetical protein
VTVQCLHYSIENKCCRLVYTPSPLINPLDIAPHCNGYKSVADCCWYKAYSSIFHKGGYP